MKAILISSGDDYAALSFEDKFSGTPVSDIIENIDNYQSEEDSEDEDEGYWEIEVVEVGDVDPLFLAFIRENIQDYDDSKHTNFWLEDETI